MELLKKDKEFLKEYEVLSYIYKMIWLLLPAFTIYSWILSPMVFLIPSILMFAYVKKKKKFLRYYKVNDDEAKIHYNYLSSVKSLKYIPLFQYFCRMNPKIRFIQIELIIKWYKLEENIIKDYFIEREYSDEDLDNAVKQLKTEDLGTKKSLINRLFQLVILADGIHNDEWKHMMQLIAQLKLNKNYVSYFKDRYESLRTEYEEYEKKNNSSENKYVPSLKEYYTTLGLDENATDEEVRRAYHELALQHHPDLPKNADRIEECEKMMMKINEAYEKVRG